LRWSVPRELLWAVIFGLFVFVVALWPLKYPYAQALKIQPQHQTENGTGGGNPSKSGPATQITPSGEQQSESGGERPSEVTILSIKPGEWLLSIITLMLWGATVGLVKGADKTASAQLRAYVSVETGDNIRQSKKRRLQFEFRPRIRNNGLTPASKVRITSLISLVPPAIPMGFNYSIPNLVTSRSVTTIGLGQERFHSRIIGRNLSVNELREIHKGTKCFHTWGFVTYDDIFGEHHQTNFSFVIFVGGKREATIWHNTEENNDAT
jgi:hypothetical protein